MKIASLALTLLITAAPALAEPALAPPAPDESAPAESGVTEIRLGTASQEGQKADRAKISAVERFLAARQAGSIDRDLASRARALLRTKDRPDDATLFGPKGATLAAFDFHDDAIAPEASGLFAVSVFLLFANEAGQVVESRDEDLFFSREEDGYVCTILRATNVIAWGQEGVREEAARLGATQELDEAQRHLVESAGGKNQRSSYSLAEVQKDADGKIVVRCLRFRSEPGKRGYEVRIAPIVLSKSTNSIRVESD